MTWITDALFLGARLNAEVNSNLVAIIKAVGFIVRLQQMAEHDIAPFYKVGRPIIRTAGDRRIIYPLNPPV